MPVDLIGVDPSALNLDVLSEEDLLDIFYLLDAEEKISCEASYFEFFKRAWQELEPKTVLNPNWHLKYLCDRLQVEMARVANRQAKGRDIIINVPFRTGKTRIVTELLQPWVWTKWPWMKFISWSYSSELSISKTVESRRVIQSEWYQRNWGDRFYLAADQNVKSHFSNNEGGTRRATSTGGTVTGQGGDVLIGDDPLNPEQSDSDTERKNCNDHYDQTMHSRLDDPKVGVRVIVMQRLHEEDLTGHLLSTDPAGWEHICIPGELNEDVKPPELRAFYKNGLFDPVRLDRAVLAGHKKRLGSYGYSGQIMQRPSPAVGGMFKKYWWGFWVPKGETALPVRFEDENKNIITCRQRELPDRFEDIGQFWDLAFDGDEDSSFVVGQAVAKLLADFFLLDQFRDQVDYVGTVKAFEAFTRTHPHILAKYVEKKANASAMIADLTQNKKIGGIIPLKAENDKVTRARPASRVCEAGNMWLPHPNLFPWVWDLIERFAKFPKTKENDEIDALAHAVNRMSSEVEYEEAQINI